ncbi:MAG: DUF4097 family beta strand repeat-containing protein [Acutalibacteraceae bacterium]
MKASKIIGIVCWALVALLLTGILITGLCGGNVFGINIFNPMNYVFRFGGSDASSFEHKEVYTIDEKEITNLTLDWTGGFAQVTPYDGDKIKITEYSNGKLEQDEKLCINTASGDATVKGTSIKNIQISTASGDINTENVSLDEISLNTASSEIQAEKIKSAAVNAETVSGNIRLGSINTNKLGVSSVSGDITSDGTYTEAESESVSGNISIEAEKMPQSLNASTTSGNITAIIPEDEKQGFTAKFSSTSGNISYNVPVMTQGDTSTYGAGRSDFSFETVSGDAYVRTK